MNTWNKIIVCIVGVCLFFLGYLLGERHNIQPATTEITVPLKVVQDMRAADSITYQINTIQGKIDNITTTSQQAHETIDSLPNSAVLEQFRSALTEFEQRHAQ